MLESPCAATIVRQPRLVARGPWPVAAIMHTNNHQSKFPLPRESFTQLQ